jgi:hypothetical protein
MGFVELAAIVELCIKGSAISENAQCQCGKFNNAIKTMVHLQE